MHKVWGTGGKGTRGCRNQHITNANICLEVAVTWVTLGNPGTGAENRAEAKLRGGQVQAKQRKKLHQVNAFLHFTTGTPAGAGHQLPSTWWESLVSAAPCTPSASLTATGRAGFSLPHKLVNNTEPTLSENCCFSPPSTSGRPRSLLHKALWCHQRTETSAWCLNWFHRVLSETGSGLQGSFTLSNLDVKPDPLILHLHKVHPRAGQTP